MAEKSLLHRGFPLNILVIALLMAFLATSVVYAVLENHKLSGGNILGGNVSYARISPDGKYAVFVGDVRIDDRSELFSVRTHGGARIRLSHDLPEDCHFVSFTVSPDSKYVVYNIEKGVVTPSHCGLYVVPIWGGTPIELYPPNLNRRVDSIKITSDGSNILFISRTSDLLSSRLYRVPAIGGDPVPITEEIVGSNIYEITPDNQHVVILQYFSSADTHSLIYSDFEGVQVPLVEDLQYIEYFEITADGAYVVYEKEGIGEDELWSVKIDGRILTQLNGGMVPGGSIASFKITPDGATVIYLADEVVVGMFQLYKVPISGIPSREPLTPWPMGNQITYKISPDSQWVVYRADAEIGDKLDLYSVPIESLVSDPYKLSVGMNNSGDVIIYEITADSKGVVIIADAITPGDKELFAVNMTGTWGERLNSDLPPFGDVEFFKILNNSQGVVYLADQTVTDVLNLYFVPILGGEIFQLNPDLVAGGNVHPGYIITPDDKGVVYIADQDSDEVRELFITYDYQKLYLPMVTK